MFIGVDRLFFDPAFRELCRANSWGGYGRCWACPPDAGDIRQLIEEAKSCGRAIVFQTVASLEDSYDFEGMTQAAHDHNVLASRLPAWAGEQGAAPGWCWEPGAAVDIGTTTTAACLFSPTGDVLAQAAGPNPQSPWVADVISRLDAARKGEDNALAQAVREGVGSLLLSMTQGAADLLLHSGRACSGGCGPVYGYAGPGGSSGPCSGGRGQACVPHIWGTRPRRVSAAAAW